MGSLKALEHRFKRGVVGLCRPFLKKGCADSTPLDGSKIKRVLFLRPERIGDMVISFPVFDGLHDAFPHIKIGIVGSPRNYEIIRNDPRFDKIFLYRKNILADLRELHRIRREDYDCVVDMICDDSVTALFLAQLCAPAKPRIGVGKTRFRAYYDFNCSYRCDNTGHVIQNTLKLLEAFDIDSSRVSGYAPPYIPAESWRYVDDYLSGLNREAQGFMLGYNLSAGSPTRLWPPERTVELLGRIHRSYPNCRTILMTAPNERQKARTIKMMADLARVHMAPAPLSLTDASALIARLDMLVSPDTSLVHIARSLRVPVLGLYTRFMKNFLLWKPYGQESGIVVSNHDDNIHDITVDQVFAAFRELYSEKNAVRQ